MEVHRRLGDYKKTEELCKQCLDMDEKSDHKNNATCINLLEALCDACREQGMFERAESYASQISVCLKDFKYCPLKHAHNINLLAHIRYDQGLYQEAIALYEQSLAIYEKNLPPENNRIIKICLKLSSLYRRTGNVMRAQELLSRASSKNLIVMAMSAYEHAHLAVHHNHYQEALDWGWKSHDLYMQIYGKQHIKTMRSLCLVGYIEFLNGQIDKAEIHFKQALQALEGQQSYLMYQALGYLSRMYRQQAEKATPEQSRIFLEQSHDYQQKAIDIAQRFFPPESAHITNLKNMK